MEKAEPSFSQDFKSFKSKIKFYYSRVQGTAKA